MVVGLIDRELREAYECQDEFLDFEDRLRKAFHKKSTLIQDLEEALKYKRTDEHVYVYKKKILTLVDKIFAHKLDKEEMTKELIFNSCRDKRMQIKIKGGKLGNSEEIFETIKANDELKEELKETDNINTVESYSNAVKRGMTKERFSRVNGTQSEDKKEITCWSCQKIGHISRNCPEKKRMCYACGSENHIRRNCDKIRCSRCGKNGHLTEQCYTNLEKRGVWTNDRRQQNNEQRNEAAQYNRREESNRRYDDNNRFIKPSGKTSVNNGFRKRDGNRYVNTMIEDDEEYIKRGDNIYYYDEETNSYREETPNRQAPSKVEMIGAMN